MSLQQQVRNTFGKGTRSKYDDGALIDVHHILMKEYGWIPLEEFKKIPLPTMYNLLGCIKRDKEKERKSLDKSKKGRR